MSKLSRLVFSCCPWLLQGLAWGPEAGPVDAGLVVVPTNSKQYSLLEETRTRTNSSLAATNLLKFGRMNTKQKGASLENCAFATAERTVHTGSEVCFLRCLLLIANVNGMHPAIRQWATRPQRSIKTAGMAQKGMSTIDHNEPSSLNWGQFYDFASLRRSNLEGV